MDPLLNSGRQSVEKKRRTHTDIFIYIERKRLDHAHKRWQLKKIISRKKIQH